MSDLLLVSTCLPLKKKMQKEVVLKLLHYISSACARSLVRSEYPTPLEPPDDRTARVQAESVDLSLGRQVGPEDEAPARGERRQVVLGKDSPTPQETVTAQLQ